MNKNQNEKEVIKSEKEFDRSICMSFFDDHRKLVQRMERLHGIEIAYKVQNLIIDYGLDGIMPTDESLLQYVPEPVLTQIDQNQKRRAKGFKGEDLETSRSIILLHRDRPELSQNAIAKQLGVSKGKVNKTLQKYENGEYNEVINLDDSNSTITPINTITSTSTNTVMTEDQCDRVTDGSTPLANAQTESATPPTESSTPAPTETATELSEIDIYNNQVTVIKLYRNRKKIKEIVDETGFEYGFVNDTVDWYMNNGKKYPDKPTEIKTLDVPLMNGGYLSRTKDELFNNATNKGKLTINDVDWQKLEQEYVMYGIAPQVIKQLINEFKKKLKNIHNITIFPNAI